MTNTVQIMCRIQNGLKLTMGAPWFNNHPPELVDRAPYLLQPGLNTVPADIWRAWAQDHADSDLISNRFVYEV